ncbi:VWFA and cache domain-containing protein CG16868 isoform X2 [Contarinia nasturtii]|uniref:VWFA and cache domain-containing protein CG16868 isoform X2 n=1 Tax=Contarinia nasturtii TaxID=265458 RepID=UPI0012D3D284|nr:VWFA and cache domain-containing protein CG16868 isoform X2 [Contarinia nasturtii]
MLLFQLSPFYQDGSVFCYIAYLTIILCGGIDVAASTATKSNDSSSSSSDNQTTSFQSFKPVATSLTSFSSVSLQTSTNSFIQKYAISDLTRDFNIQLKSIEDHELLVSVIQSAFDSLDRLPSSIDHNDTKLLNSIATKIETKLSTALRILNETNQKFVNILTENGQSRKLLLDSIILPCASSTKQHSERSTYDLNGDDSDQNEFIGGINKKKAIEVLNFLKNAGHLHENDDRNFTINKRLMETLKNIDLSTSANVPNFRDVFFLPRDNQISSTNCRNTVPNEHHRFLYASSVTSKKIVLIVDFGATTATNSDSFDVIKSFAQIILNLLSENDDLFVMAISNSVHISANKFLPMNPNNKSQLRKFIESLEKETNATNHSLAFEYAFKWIKSQSDFGAISFDGKSTPLQILYVSRGSIVQLSETKTVLEVIASGQKRLKQPIVINTCAIILDEKRSIHGKEFLSDIATQNYTKYNIDVNNSNKTKSWYHQLHDYNQNGRMFVVNHRNINDMFATAAVAVTDIWFKQQFLKSHTVVHQPFYDQIVKGMTIWHPSFPRSNIVSYEPTYATDIKYFEKTSENIRKRWLTEDVGIVQVSDSKTNKSKVYRWRRLSEWYIICLVHVLPYTEQTSVEEKHMLIAHSYKTPIVLSSTNRANLEAFNNISVDSYTDAENQVVFHRLDLAISIKLNDQQQQDDTPKLCQYFKQISVFNTATLYLSPRTFKSPFQHLSTMCANDIDANDDKQRHEHCYHRIENIMAYIKDTTNLLTNPGLQPHIRSDVLTLSHAIELLRMQHQYRSKIEKYVVRRYVTSINGIMLMYPGFPLPNDFDPSRRVWFQKAIENANKLTITPPYLDIGGAGYIVTISRVIFENRKLSETNSNNQRQRKAIAIVSIDVTLGFLYQVLLQSSDYCRRDENIKCFIIDEFGYLVVYPNNFDSKMQLSSFDSQFNLNEHITHRESLIANDILLHKSLVQKRMCQNLLNRKVERYYKFNTSVVGPLTNFVNGERTKYQIEAIPNTNLFVIMKNSSEGGGGAAFCPCSTIDKVCFNCKRIELMNCECPCECSIDNLSTGSIVTEYMYGDLLEDEKNTFDKKINLFDSIEICSRPIEEFIPNKKISRTNQLSALGQCANFTCEIYSNQLDCLGILGCVWCEIDIDQTILLSPFCTQQSSCFGGILGSNTPYGDGDIGSIIDSIRFDSAYAAIGPIVIGAVVVLFIVIGFAMYCYRNNLEPGSEHLYVESMAVEHNFGLPLSRLDYDTILPHNGLGNDVVDKRTNAVSSDSPYRSAGYFRRLPNGESDHGYSTMTPHDDSDHACFTLVEPLINNKCSNQSISDSASFNTEPASSSCIIYGQSCGSKTDGLASPIKSYFEHKSEISSPHRHIQAPVTVHHPME